MPVGLLGRKIGMTQIYDDEGVLIPATVIEAGPCVVTQLRTQEHDGYEAVQVGYLDKPRRKASRSERGHVAQLGGKRQRQRAQAGREPQPKPNCEPKRFLREFRTDGEDHGLQLGQSLTVALFAEVPYVDVTGTSKGRGTAGVMKRHNFAGQPASHGAKKVHRHVGGIGAHATNRGWCGGIKKGKRMAGRYGNARATVRHLKVVRVDEANNMLIVRGAVPGPPGGLVQIRQTNKR